ncbi:alanine-tRNA ligase [Phytophthora nicotianae INRA-310]|uniref:Alanine--tRNA ligase n=1 Tax=Phytophthora nicotianae (strain INRA-310) TaxID=761204 RepID=W2PGV0_PHYN3|nr:alanine-tRNA ligase [Phytophthora nicotianae INRA-310]ETM99453.1 alanine-tRNA ligase [Phytophthora nicotianae INRA-310]
MSGLESKVTSQEKAVAASDVRVEALEGQVADLSPFSVENWPAARIRKTFVEYFENQKDLPHTFYKSCPVVPLDDPTLLFINAGMNQYKPIFLGQVDPSHPMAKLVRACNSQKCIRAGGKHNDLDDVGKDVYHHTFFEMLGNWSFGNYFKKEAVHLSFTLLTEVFGIDKDRLYATYFGGDEKQGLPSDEETREIWLNYLPAERVLPFGCKDSFWEMGDVGPCGPCTEIHYDRIGNRDASKLVNADLPDVIEIWNNVFIQFNREQDGKLVPLPHKHVDTGMGFERLASILQGKDSNYDTDVFTPLFAAIQKSTKAAPYTGKLGKEDPDKKDMAYRVVADHVRTLTFAITDGAVPSNDGRGYVLRRILRRAVRYGQQFLNAPSGFLTELVPVVVNMLGEAFPELIQKQKEVEEIILDEEKSFGRTLNKGIERFKKIAQGIREANKLVVPGEDAFFLYDSMGFPIDLTEIMAEEEGMTVDIKGYEECMRLQSERSKMDRKKGGSNGARPLVLEARETSTLAGKHISATDDMAKYEWNIKTPAKVVAIFTTTESSSDFVDEVKAGDFERVGVILDKTSFYSQAGGQIYDTGVLSAANFKLDVDSVESYAGYVMHMGPIASGSIKVGDSVECQVDYARRAKIAPNHTMTHALNFALRKVLGTVVDQRGSLVDESRLRFDFTNNKALKPNQLAEVEAICDDIIKQQLEVYTQNSAQAEAKRIQGLRAVFGETYPDFVRVVSIGQPIAPMLEDPENSNWSNFSVEFCGGTHLKNTKEAKKFVLYEEGAIAKGIRRVSAYTCDLAVEAEERGAKLQAELDAIDKLDGNEFVESVSAFKPVLDQALISLPLKDKLRKQVDGLVTRVKKIKKEAAAARAANGVRDATAEATKAKEAGQEIVIVKFDVGTDSKLGREMLEAMSTIIPTGSFMIFSTDSDANKTAAFTQVSQHHVDTKQLDARKWVNHAMAVMKGKGGGKDALNATGQAKTVEKVDEAVTLAKSFVQ